MTILKLGSLFDGSGGFPLAGVMHGVTPVWASEIEPYPVRVTTARFPGMKHLGDITLINGAEIEPVDIITFGSPCQDLSVAGKQAGLHKGERSNLFFEAIRIIKEMRNATGKLYPRIAIWENVPGAYSSNNGKDFQSVLQAFVGLSGEAVSIPKPQGGKWAAAGCIVGVGYSVAWRTLDAQYNGVPQRRKRCYLIADFGSERAGEILFEQESVRGHSSESGTAGQSAAGDAARSVGRGCEPVGFQSSQSGFRLCATHATLDANNGSRRQNGVCYPVGDAEGSAGRGVWPVISGSLCARADSSPCVDRGQPFIVFKERAGCPGGGKGILCGDKPFTLSTLTDQAVCYAVRTRNTTANGWGVAENAYTLDTSEGQAVCFQACGDRDNPNISVSDKAYCIPANPMSDRGQAVCYAYDQYNGAIADKQAALGTNCGMSTGRNGVCYAAGFKAGQSKDASLGYQEECAATLSAQASGTEPTVCYALQGNGIDRADTAGCNGAGWRENECYTLNTIDRPAVCYQNKVGALCGTDYKWVQQQQVEQDKLIAYPIDSHQQDSRCMHDQQIALYTKQAIGHYCELKVASTQQARQYKSADDLVVSSAKPPRRYIIRRLTPLECCRLQGMPDWWMDGVEGSDSAKYKMFGNGIAMPNAIYAVGCAVQLIQEGNRENKG